MASHEDRIIAELVAHPAWAALVERFHVEREKSFVKTARQLMAGTFDPDRETLGELRGFWRGGLWFLDEVDRAAKRMDRDVFSQREGEQ